MTWERALEADARLAAKNAVLIRAALRQAIDPERIYAGYKNTTPDESLSLPQQRIRARAWAIMNVRVNLEPLKEVIYRLWAQGYALGDTAAREAIAQAKIAQKADTQSLVDWSKWKPGDAVSALLLKPPRAFQQLLQNQGITFKGFSDTTLTDIGNAVGEAIYLGLDAKKSAKLIGQHVANPARALSIAITEQNRAISQATVNRYRDAGLQQQEWLVFQPCDICAKNANVKVNIGAPFPSGDLQPPAHPHCRCALAPVIPGFDDPANTAGSVTEPIISPDEMIAQQSNEDYRGFHRAPSRMDDVGGPATDVETGLMPDFYERPGIYTTGMPQADKESVEVLLAIRNKPDAMVTIYRAVPTNVNEINPGDWVTLSPTYANTHLLSNLEGGHVISARIPAKDLWFDANSINEFGFDPLDKKGIKVSFAGRNIEKELAPLFKTTSLGTLENKQIADEIMAMQAKDVAMGGTAGDAYLTKIAEMQGFTGKPRLVDTVEELKIKQKAGEGTLLWRGISDFSKDVEDGILEAQPKITYTAKKAVEDFMTGEYRSGWGSFGSGTYTTTDLDMAKQYAAGVSEGQMGNGQVMAMLLPKNAVMPTREVVKATFREIMDKPAFDSGYNIGRALAAKGYQAYDVGFLQEDKAGIYVILDRSILTVAKETR